MMADGGPVETRAVLRRRRQQQVNGPAMPAWSAPRPAVPGRRRYALAIVGGPHTEWPGIDREVFRRVRATLRARVTSTRNLTELDVWLGAPGGDVEAAYKLALLLRSYAAVLRVVVPDQAKGAATLLVLAADEIYMAPAAELGPVDVPMPLERDRTPTTALDVVRNAEGVSRVALDFAVTAATTLSRTQGLSRAECLDVAVRLSVELHQPMLRAVDPALLLHARHLLDATARYADALLAMRNPDVLAAAPDGVTAEALFADLPGRDFVIDIDEAAQLGLPVQPLWHYPAAEAAQALLEHVEAGGGPVLDVREGGIDLRSVVEEATPPEGPPPAPSHLRPPSPPRPAPVRMPSALVPTAPVITASDDDEDDPDDHPGGTSPA